MLLLHIVSKLECTYKCLELSGGGLSGPYSVKGSPSLAASPLAARAMAITLRTKRGALATAPIWQRQRTTATKCTRRSYSQATRWRR